MSMLARGIRESLRPIALAVLGKCPKSVRDAVDRFFYRPPREPARLGEDTNAQVPMQAWFLESPQVTSSPSSEGIFEVRGWIGAPTPVEGIRFADPQVAKILPLALADRPDITKLHGLPAKGFSASCRYEFVRDRSALKLLFTADGRESEILVPTYRQPADAAIVRAGKMARIRAIVRCPVCSSEALNDGGDKLTCASCGMTFPRTATSLDFLTPELRAKFNIVSTDNVSSNHYDGEALNIIHRLRDGLVLDCGSGMRDRHFANVVNYEIVPYASTDVVGVGERLPFRDASFDAVFSFAVLEHVKDPFTCAAELLRVLKPGGTLYCQVPFLQPVHGYPHHYYNMTNTGLRNLFGDSIRVERSGPFLFGQPVFALSWMLARYADSLPPAQRAQFKAMRVEDLLRPGAEYLGAGFVTELTPAAREELSCCNCLIATKAP